MPAREITQNTMPYSIMSDPQGIISIKVQGPLTLDIVRAITVDAVQLAKEQGCFQVLNDLRDADLKLSMLDVYTIPKVSSGIMAATGLRASMFRRALIAPVGEKLLPFFENVFRNRLQTVKLFYDIESARQWLLSA